MNKITWLNYQHLYYFWQVANCGGVTKASLLLRLAQPTISAQIKSFEDNLGVKLLERSGRNLVLTDLGKVVYKYADRIFQLGSEMLDAIEGKQTKIIRELRVGLSDVVPKSIAYNLIKPAMQSVSEVSVDCYEDKTERLLAELAISELDMVIADRPIAPSSKIKVYNHYIGQSEVVFLASEALVKRYKKDFPSSLNQAPLILPTLESAVRTELDRWFSKLSIQPKSIASFQDRALMKLAAKDGRGIIIVPQVVEQQVKKEFSLKLLGRVSEVKEQIYIITAERKLKDPIIIEICNKGQLAFLP